MDIALGRARGAGLGARASRQRVPKLRERREGRARSVRQRLSGHARDAADGERAGHEHADGAGKRLLQLAVSRSARIGVADGLFPPDLRQCLAGHPSFDLHQGRAGLAGRIHRQHPAGRDGYDVLCDRAVFRQRRRAQDQKRAGHRADR